MFRVVSIVAKLLCIALFILPIAAMVQHARALREAERRFNEQQATAQREISKMIKEYNRGQRQ